MDGIEVGFPLSPALDRDQVDTLQFGDQLCDPRTGHAHILRESILAREAGIVVPGVAQKHGVNHLGANRQSAVAQYEIGHLRKTLPDHGIGGIQQNIALLDDLANGLHGVI